MTLIRRVQLRNKFSKRKCIFYKKCANSIDTLHVKFTILDAKEMEPCLDPMDEVFDAELRHTQNRAQFPMAVKVFHMLEE